MYYEPWYGENMEQNSKCHPILIRYNQPVIIRPLSNHILNELLH